MISRENKELLFKIQEIDSRRLKWQKMKVRNTIKQKNKAISELLDILRKNDGERFLA
jgi:hypothetical protein